MSECYSGVECLEVMQEANNYNNYLASIVISESRGETAALDFGAGIGTFAAALRNQGIRVICIEPDDSLRLKLQGQGFETYPSLIAIPEQSLSYIYSLNVLEHIENDFEVLAELYRRLKPGGKLLIYVPAFGVLFSSLDKKVGHKRRYTRAGLTELLKAAGFEISLARYVDSLGFVAALLFKAIGNKEGNLNRTGVKLFDRLIFPLSVIADRLMHSIAGKNLLVVAARPLE